MLSLHATPRENWICCYKDMARIHELLDGANLVVDAQEYVTIVEQMVKLVQAVSAVSRVQINAASAFALWLLRSQCLPKQKRKRSRKKKSTSSERTKKSRVTTPKQTSRGKKGI